MKKFLLFFAALLISAVTMAQTPTVSASSVTFKYCQTTYGVDEIACLDNPMWHGESFTQPGSYVRTFTNARGCDSVVTLTVVYAYGALSHRFSVSSTKKVLFSKGNLQYCPSPSSGPNTHNTMQGEKSGIWRFAEHQYDWAGDATRGNVSGGNNANRNSFYWLDLYMTGQTGYYYTSDKVYENKSYAPNTGNYSNYAWSDVYIWGVFNAISNGGNVVGGWTLLTNTEMNYLLNSREGAADKRGSATVNGVVGFIFLPDEWVLPSGLNFVANGSKTQNQYSVDDWARMEANGAVFLPLAGYCGNNGADWDSSSAHWDRGIYFTGGARANYGYPYVFEFTGSSTPGGVTTTCGYTRCSVRLVREIQ